MDYLSQIEQKQLKSLRATEAFVDEVLCQLDRILDSPRFQRVQRNARDFLGFVVAKKLLDLGGEIKETLIAVHVYGEPADFNPAETNRIRAAGGSLRQRLLEYYAEEGRQDPIEILIPIGTYAPDIRDRRSAVAVSVFENWNPKGDQDHLCATVSDEIVHRLTSAGAFYAKRVTALAAGGHNPQHGLRGSLECRGDFLRLNISLSDLYAGQIIFCQTFEARRDDIFRLSGEVAAAILGALRPSARSDVA